MIDIREHGGPFGGGSKYKSGTVLGEDDLVESIKYPVGTYRVRSSASVSGYFYDAYQVIIKRPTRYVAFNTDYDKRIILDSNLNIVSESDYAHTQIIEGGHKNNIVVLSNGDRVIKEGQRFKRVNSLGGVSDLSLPLPESSDNYLGSVLLWQNVDSTITTIARQTQGGSIIKIFHFKNDLTLIRSFNISGDFQIGSKAIYDSVNNVYYITSTDAPNPYGASGERMFFGIYNESGTLVTSKKVSAYGAESFFSMSPATGGLYIIGGIFSNFNTSQFYRHDFFHFDKSGNLVERIEDFFSNSLNGYPSDYIANTMAPYKHNGIRICSDKDGDFTCCIYSSDRHLNGNLAKKKVYGEHYGDSVNMADKNHIFIDTKENSGFEPKSRNALVKYSNTVTIK